MKLKDGQKITLTAEQTAKFFSYLMDDLKRIAREDQQKQKLGNKDKNIS